MKNNNTFAFSMALVWYVILSATPITTIARTGLSIYAVGSWDLDISNIKISKASIERQQNQTILVFVKTVESTDNTGNVRVDLIIKAAGRQILKKSRIGNVGAKGSERYFEFNYSPEKIGEYVLDVEVWGGTAYTWRFDTTTDGFYRSQFNQSFRSAPSSYDRDAMVNILNKFSDFFSHDFWQDKAESESRRLLNGFVSEAYSAINLLTSIVLAGRPAGPLFDAANSLKTISAARDAIGFSMAGSILVTLDPAQELSRLFKETARAFSNNSNRKSKLNHLLDRIAYYENAIKNKRMEDVEGVGHIQDLPFGSGLTAYTKAKNTLLIALESGHELALGLDSIQRM